MIVWILGAMAVLVLAVLLIAYVCFRMAFYSKPRKPRTDDTVEIPGVYGKMGEGSPGDAPAAIYGHFF